MTVSNGNKTTATPDAPARPRYALYGIIAAVALVVIVLALYLLPVSVNGQVSDAGSSQLLADAKITLSTGQEVRSDAQGRFTAKASRFQPVTASVDEAAFQPWQGEPAFSFLPLAPATLAASLQPTLLQGQVVDAVDSQPVGGATVTAGDQTVTTDAEGRFEMRGLSREGETLSLAAENYIAYEQTLTEWPADGAQPISLPIYPNGLHGTITDAATDQPLAAAAASLNGQRSDSLDNGFFYFPSSVGTGPISVTVPGYLPIAVNVTTEAALQGQEPVDLALTPTVLAGTVTDGQTGKPLAGVALTAGGQTATTDELGAYRIERLHGAGLSLAGVLANYEAAEQPIDETTNLLDGQPLDLVLLPPHLAGRLVNEVTDSPVVSATVTAGDLSAITDADGQFILWTDKTPLEIEANAIGYEPGKATFTEDANLSVALKPKGVVMTVLDKSGKPVSGVQISGPRSEAITDKQGIALLPLLEPGEVFTATAENFATVSQAFDGQAQQQLTFFPNTVAGRVVDAATGEGVLGTIVYVYDKAMCEGEACRGTKPVVLVDAGADGSFEVSGMPANPQLMLKAPGYSLLFPAELQAGDCGAPYCLDAQMQPFEARGTYMKFDDLGSRELVIQRLDQVAESPFINAIVVDLKDERGLTTWEPENPIARELGIRAPNRMSAQEFVALAKERGIYVIARFLTFQDNALAEGRPEWAIRAKANPDQPWYESPNTPIPKAYVSAFRPEVREYEIALAQELATIGVDEIQFDYFRFPGRSKPEDYIYGAESTAQTRREAISSFSHELMAALKPYGVFTAIDVFGSIIVNGNEPLIGQNLEDLMIGVDYLSPMIYPQVWEPRDFPECGDPVLCPYTVVYESVAKAIELTPLPTKVRPWIQGYDNNYRQEGPARGYFFAVPEMLIQRQAAEDAGAAGWLFWSGGANMPDEIFGPMPSLPELEAQIRARQGGRSGPY